MSSTSYPATRILRCVVVTGAGGKAFGSGNDITEFEAVRGNAAKVEVYNRLTMRTLRAVEASLHPTVARIEGYCLGGGLEIALGCDIRVATASSRFGMPVKNMGIFLDPALADTLVRMLGRATALELVLEGRILEAQEALDRRIVTRVVEDGALDDEIAATVERISAGAPLAARYNRRVLRAVEAALPDDDAELVAAASYGDSEDYHNAYRAFLERGKAEFKGR